ncbi:hypothetical protein B0H19DRAFT_1071924 [Mycena capillaripes]|nr:hypothetical protein B0H19DRAFT_1071924 [Mycena capillaripes]
MPSHSTGLIFEARLKNLRASLMTAAEMIKPITESLPFLQPISNTTQYLLESIEAAKHNKTDCMVLLEKTAELLYTIIALYLDSSPPAELPASTLDRIRDYTRSLDKICTVIEAQQGGSKMRNFFRQGQSSALLKECRAELEQISNFFKVKELNDEESRTEVIV